MLVELTIISTYYHTKDDVALMVNVDFITKDDFKKIVGEDYDEYVASKKVI